MVDEHQLAQQLRALPDAWSEEVLDNGFSSHMSNVLARRERRRATVLSAAGIVGGLIAGTSASRVVENEPIVSIAASILPALQPLQSLVTPQFLIMLAMAAVISSVAIILPGRI